MQAWTFKKYTLFEAIDRTASLGLDWIEAYPGQKVGGPYPDTEFKPGVSKEVRSAVKKKLKQAGLRLSNFGVVGLPDDEGKCRKVFEFAEDMGVRTIVSEPPMEAIDTISELCEEYEIPVAIHNHPKPSPYWNPDRVLEASRGIFDVTRVGTVTAIRQITVERGLDPRDFAMVAYGGAGPLFLPLVAREMNISEIVIPRSPSVFSAKGMLG